MEYLNTSTICKQFISGPNCVINYLGWEGGNVVVGEIYGEQLAEGREGLLRDNVQLAVGHRDLSQASQFCGVEGVWCQ